MIYFTFSVCSFYLSTAVITLRLVFGVGKPDIYFVGKELVILLQRVVTFCDVLCCTVFAVWYLGWDLEFNPFMMNGFSHHYHLDESIFIFRGVRSDYYFLFHFSMKFLCYSVGLCPTKRTPGL